MNNTFATCLSCIDGRIQLPVIDWIKENYHVDYVDMITELGMDGVLFSSESAIDDIITKAQFSLEKHDSKHVFVVGHHDCQGNPCDDQTHKKQICQATERLQQLDISADIIGLWVSDQWQVEEVTVQTK